MARGPSPAWPRLRSSRRRRHQYHTVLRWAADRGLRVPDHVAFFLQFGTVDVRDYCRQRGYIESFRAVGAELLNPASGACAQCGPGVSTRPVQVTISAINRLASPATVAASSMAGHIASFDDLRAQAS